MAPGYTISTTTHHRDEAALTLLAHITETSHGHTSKLSDLTLRLSVIEDGIITRNDIIPGTGVTIAEDQAQNTITISIGQEVAHSSNVIFNQITANDNVTINGDLTVNGGSTYIYSTTKVIKDPLIELANGNNANDYDIGFYGTYYSNSQKYHTGLVWDASESKYRLFENLTAVPNNNEFTFSSHNVASLEANIIDISNHGINSLNDVDTITNSPISGQVLAWNGTNWVPTDDNNDTYTGGNGITINNNDISIEFTEFTADDITEGTTNLFHTSERVDDRVNDLLQAGSNITLTYDDNNGTLTIDATDTNTEYTGGNGITINNNNDISIEFTEFTTDDITEGTTNLFHTSERVDDRVNDLLQAGSNITLTYDDNNGTLTIDATDTNTEYTAGTGVNIDQNNVISIGQNVATTSDVIFGSVRINNSITNPYTYGETYSPGDLIIGGDNNPPLLTFHNPSTDVSADDECGVIQFCSKDDAQVGYCIAKIKVAHQTGAASGNSGGGYITFHTSAGGTGTSSVENVRIDHLGNLGINTDNPQFKLHVVGDNNTTATRIECGSSANYSFSGNSTSLYSTTFDMNDTALRIGHNSSNRYFHLQTNSTSRISIKGTGSIGINNENPFCPFDIFGESNTPLRVHRPNNALVTSVWGIGFSTRNDGGPASTDIRTGVYAKYNGHLFIANDTSNVHTDPETNHTIWFSNNNHVGIGTKIPLAPFHVDKNTSTQGHAVIIGDTTSYVNSAAYHYSTFASVSISGRLTNTDGSVTDNWAGIQFTTRNAAGTNWNHGYTTFNDEGDIEHGLSGLGTSTASTSVKIGETGTGYIISNSYDETATNPHVRSFTITSGTKSLSDSKGAYIRGYGVDSTLTPGLLQLNAGNTSTGEIIMYAGGNNRVNIKNGGNVGISEDDPQSLLHLTGDSQSWTTSPTIIFESTNTNANVRNWRIGPADTNFGNFHIAKSATQGTYPDSDAEAQIFTIDYQGNVGINTTTPNVQLDIVGGVTTGGQIRLSSTESATSTLKDTRIVSRHYDPSEEDIMLIGCRSDSSSTIVRIGGGRAECNTATQVLIYTADAINEINNDPFVNITNNHFGIDTGPTGPQRKFHLVNRDGDSTTCFAMENIRANSNTNQNTTVISFREEVFTAGVGTTFHESGAIQFKMENSNTDTNNGLHSSLSLYTYNEATFSDNFSLIGENSDTKGKHRARKGTTTDNECIMYTFRVTNTGNSGNIWVKLGTFTAGQSSRIQLILHGQSSYSGSQGNTSGNCTITGQVNNSNTLEGNFHQEGGKKSILGVNFTSTNSTTHEIYIQVGSYSEYGCQVNCSNGTFTHGVVQNVSGISANIGSTKKHFNPNGTYFSEGDVGIGIENTNGRRIRVHGSGDLAQFTCTNNTSGGSQIDLSHERADASPANGDKVGIINFGGLDSGGTNPTLYGTISVEADDVANRHGHIVFKTRDGSAYSERMRILETGAVQIKKGVEHFSGTTSLTAIEHSYRFSTTSWNNGAGYVHLKTDISWGTSSQMFSLEFKGHEYGASLPVNVHLVFYNYSSTGSVINIGSVGTHTMTVYESSDSKIVIRKAFTNGYYIAFTMSQYTTSQGLARFNITSEAINATANYF